MRTVQKMETLPRNDTALESLYACCRKMDADNPVDEELRAVIRTFCEELVQAVNGYYAFGSIFSDDAT